MIDRVLESSVENVQSLEFCSNFLYVMESVKPQVFRLECGHSRVGPCVPEASGSQAMII